MKKDIKYFMIKKIFNDLFEFKINNYDYLKDLIIIKLLMRKKNLYS